MNIRTINRLFVFIVFAISFMAINNNANAQVFIDPLLEESYHVKYDLTWIKDFMEKTLTSNMDASQRSIFKKKLDLIEKMGFYDLKDVTYDSKLDGDRFVGSAKITVNMKSPGTNIIRNIISYPPRASVVRALIPEEETIAWISISDPGVMIETIDEIANMTKSTKEGKQPECCDEIMKILDQVKDYLGDEAHLVVYDILNTENEMSPQPRFDFAYVASMKDGITDNELNALRNLAKSILVDKFGGKVVESMWNDYKVQTFSEFGCPLDIKPSLIVDKYFLIFATYPESLEKTASFVLTPQRTAQSRMPVIMNAMITVNFDYLMKKEIPKEFFGSMASMLIGGDFAILESQIKEEQWGNIQVIRTHLSDGVLIEYSIDRSIFSFLCTIMRSGMAFIVQDLMPHTPQ